jgi:DNA polymerase sigma
MPYDIGDAKLEKAKGQLKKKLSLDEEKRLTQAMRELYQGLLPSESEDRRARFVQKLEKLLNNEWPGNDIRVHVFGSSGNKLCTIDSDGKWARIIASGSPKADLPSGYLHHDTDEGVGESLHAGECTCGT